MNFTTSIVNLNDLQTFVQTVIDNGSYVHMIFVSPLGGPAYVTIANLIP